MGASASMSPFSCSWDSFLPMMLPLPALIGEFLVCLIIFCFDMFGCCLLEGCYFLKRKGVSLGKRGSELQGGEGRETGADP